MPIDPIFQRVFGKLYGKPCWGVKCMGTALYFEFGEPHLKVHEPIIAARNHSRRVREALARRQVLVEGQWNLTTWICDWEILRKGKRLGSHSAKSNMDRIVQSLDGQKLVRFSINASGTRCKFEFDLGGVLVTSRPDPDYDHWVLFEPSRHALTLHGDGRYSYQRSDQPRSSGQMKPIVLKQK